MKRQSRKGFTLIELLVVVAIIALLIAILIPSLGKAKELANRATCSANLHGVMESMILYAAEGATGGGGAFPCVYNSDNTGKAYTIESAGQPVGTQSTAAAALADMQAGTGALAAVQGSPTAGLWFLVLRGQTPPKNYICKSDSSANIGPAPQSNSASSKYYEDFSGSMISYAVAYAWNSSGGSGAWYKDNTDSTCPYLSDIPPQQGGSFQGVTANVTLAATAGTAGAAINSPNHAGAGQNVAFGDVHVEWKPNPACGTTPAANALTGQGDNIFTTAPTIASGQTGDAKGNTPTGAAGIGGAILTSSAPFDIMVVPARASVAGVVAGTF